MHLKTCFEQYSCIKTIQLFFCFTTKVQRPTTRVLVMPKASHFALNLGTLSNHKEF